MCCCLSRGERIASTVVHVTTHALTPQHDKSATRIAVRPLKNVSLISVTRQTELSKHHSWRQNIHPQLTNRIKKTIRMPPYCRVPKEGTAQKPHAWEQERAQKPRSAPSLDVENDTQKEAHNARLSKGC